MNFDQNIPIYIQIEDFIQNKIIHSVWAPNERIPSVRELAELLEVNPNTVMRSYERLERQSVIYNQRGVGFYVSPMAQSQIKENRTKKFYLSLTEFFKEMKLLDISMEELIQKHSESTTKSKSQ